MLRNKNGLAAILLTGVIAASSIIIPEGQAYAAGNVNFTDLKGYGWAKDYISVLTEKGGINGYPDGTFKPGNTMTNAEFIKTVVSSITGKEMEKTRKHWASGYIDYALDNGIIQEGELNNLAYDSAATREKMAVIIARAADKLLDEDIVASDRQEVAKSIFDYNNLCDYCKDYVIDVYRAGIINGYADHTFGGKKTATRAEATAMIVRLLDESKRVEYAPVNVQTGKVKDIIDNVEYGPDLKCDDYILINDIAPYNIRLNDNKSFYIENSPIEGQTYLMKDRTLIIPVNNIFTGNKNLYEMPKGHDNYSKYNVTDMDYIIGINIEAGVTIVIPNPLKK